MCPLDPLPRDPGGDRDSSNAYEAFNTVKWSAAAGPSFDGLIQHSFALQLPLAREFHQTSGWLPRRGKQVKSSTNASASQYRYQRRVYEQLRSLFEDPSDAFGLKIPVQMLDQPDRAGRGDREVPGGHSWLVRKRHTHLDPQPFAATEGLPDLPAPLAWAVGGGSTRPDWSGFIFALSDRPGWDGRERGPVANDLLIEDGDVQPASGDPRAVSRVLYQLWAHWRSRLFGMSLAHRFFNVFLPPALLLEERGDGRAPQAAEGRWGGERSWLLQPFLSFVRDPDGPRRRRTFTFTALLVPVSVDRGLVGPRAVDAKMSTKEIEEAIRGAWSLAAGHAPHRQSRFRLDGPLQRYLANVGYRLPQSALTVREWVEATIFRLAQLERDRIGGWRMRDVPSDDDLGDRVLTSLASSRVSAVTVVDTDLKQQDVRHEAIYREAGGERLFPGCLHTLMRAVTGRTYLAPVPTYRVDRAFLDRDDYVECVVPAAKCLITTTTTRAQKGYERSGLRLSVFTGYMALGAATAQALIRSSYHEIEAHADPKQFGEISKEFTRDFHEIYDLDIVWESYKRTYRTILEQLDIINDYDALRRKLDLLYNRTVAEFNEWQHTRLWFVTWLLAGLTVAVVVATILK